MKSANVLRLLTFLCFAGILFLTGSCKKIVDLLITNPLATVEGCRIEKIVQWETPISDPRTYTFKYNSLCNPVSIIGDMPSSSGAPNYFFRYDSKNRLSESLGFYDNDYYEFWTKYFYDDRGRVVGDSSWVFGLKGEQPDPNSVFIYVSKYIYDVYGRITKIIAEEFQFTPGQIYTYEYYYNPYGNLMREFPYDEDHVSIYRTHKLWMFLNRNYSVNTSPPALSYNSHKLPTRFWDSSSINFLGMNIGNSEIYYSCD